MKKKKKKEKQIRIFRNWDAQKFIDLAKFRKRQAREIEQMNKSFEKEMDELDSRMDYAIAKDD